MLRIMGGTELHMVGTCNKTKHKPIGSNSLLSHKPHPNDSRSWFIVTERSGGSPRSKANRSRFINKLN